MASVILDITTRGLDDAIRNVQGASDLITAGTATHMKRWYNTHMKKSMLSIIESGGGMPPNSEDYAVWKLNNHGIDHPLGRISGLLYFSVSMLQPDVKETRGTEVRFALRFEEPYYAAYVLDGTHGRKGYGFANLAREKNWEILLKELGSMFDGLDFTRPYPELMSSIIGPNTAPSLQSYG